MTAWGVTAGCLVVAVVAAGCGDTDEPDAVERPRSSVTTTSVAERPTTTPSTVYSPDSVEGQVEAAYLESWEVYADAVYHLRLDEEALGRVFADDAFDLRASEVRRRISQARASLVELEHRYDIVVAGTSATVVDNFVNHQVRIDAQTREVIEPDPNQTLLVQFTLKLRDGRWRVTFIEKVNT